MRFLRKICDKATSLISYWCDPEGDRHKRGSREVIEVGGEGENDGRGKETRRWWERKTNNVVSARSDWT